MPNPVGRIRALIVDDEQLARETVRLNLQREDDIVIVGEAGSGFHAIGLVETLKPDVLFLDVQMPDISGFDVLGALKPTDLPRVIFVTAHDRFAVKAFDTHALDYVLKPFSPSRFQDAVRRLRSDMVNSADEKTRQRLMAALEEHRREQPVPAPNDSGYLHRLVVSNDRRIALVAVSAIDWVASCANYVRLHTGGRSRLLRMTMAELEQRLDPAKFVRIHRSTIVQIDRIKDITASLHGDYDVILGDGTKLRLSRKYRSRLEL